MHMLRVNAGLSHASPADCKDKSNIPLSRVYAIYFKRKSLIRTLHSISQFRTTKPAVHRHVYISTLDIIIQLSEVDSNLFLLSLTHIKQSSYTEELAVVAEARRDRAEHTLYIASRIKIRVFPCK